MDKYGDKLLVIFNGKVFDLTEFSKLHPGGEEILMEYKGRDVTGVLNDSSIHEHSDFALEMLNEFYLGEKSDFHNHNHQINATLIEKNSPASTRSSSPPLQTPSSLHLFDESKPLFSQIWNMEISRDDYLRMVHTPHHSRHSFRFFKSDMLEILSRTYWWMIPLVWTPIILTLYYCSSFIIGFKQASQLTISGIALWTLLEYSLHRFVFHIDNAMPDHRLAITLHFTLHGVHHYFPMDKLRLVFPPALGIVIAMFLLALFNIFFPFYQSLAVLSGGLIGYVCYDLCHYYLHHGIPLSSHLKYMKSYHLDHHYKNHNLGYGITSAFWDRIFGTVLHQ